MFSEIKGSDQWIKFEKIHRGWSSDEKYYIETKNHEKLVLRLADIKNYDLKLNEYEQIKMFSKLGFEMSMPVDFGICNHNKHVYMLLTWVEGEDLESALPKLPIDSQYHLGVKAGKILKKMHQIQVPSDKTPETTKASKKLAQLKRYETSLLRVNHDEDVIDFIKENMDKIWSEKPVFQHGDYHPGNLILTPNEDIGVIDFNRVEIGDPYEEFYKLESFGTEVSIPYCVGQIDAYFNHDVPHKFWEILAVYVAHASLYSIVWAEKFGQKDIDNMVKICNKSFNHYNDFKSVIPIWYKTFNKQS